VRGLEARLISVGCQGAVVRHEDLIAVARIDRGFVIGGSSDRFLNRLTVRNKPDGICQLSEPGKLCFPFTARPFSRSNEAAGAGCEIPLFTLNVKVAKRSAVLISTS
jgi:hypothetical protein